MAFVFRARANRDQKESEAPTRIMRPLAVRVAIVLGCAAVIALAWALVLKRLHHDLENTVQGVMRQNANLVIAYEQHTIRTLEAIDQAVLFLRREYLEEGPAVRLDTLFAEGWASRADVTYAAIIDERGVTIRDTKASEGLDVSDSDYFRHHRESAGDVLRLGVPMVSRFDGRPTLMATRRIQGPDGSFRGVALVALSPDHFAEFSSQIDTGRNGVIVLVGIDSSAELRGQRVLNFFGNGMHDRELVQRAARAPAAGFVTPGRSDGTRRFLSYRKLQDYPFVVAVGTSVEESLAPFNMRENYYYGGAAAASLLAVFFGIALLVARGRQEKAAAQKARSDARYRATFEQGAVGIALVNLDQRLIGANRAFCGMLGYSEDELRTRCVSDITHSDNRDFNREHSMRDLSLFPGAPCPSNEKQYFRKDSSVFWGMTTISLVRDTRSEPEYFVAMVQDISESKRAADLLRESERRFTIALEGGALATWETNLENGENFWDERLGGLLGVPPERVAVESKRWIEYVHPEDRDGVAAAFAAASRDSEGRFDQDFRVVRTDGSIRWFASRGAHANWQGTPRMAGVVQDITARKLAEQRHRELAARVVGALEDERKRIAHELHDDVGQALTAVQLNLQAVRRARTAALRQMALADSLAVVDEAVETVRSMSLNLRPRILDELGLAPALTWYCERQAKRAGLSLQVKCPTGGVAAKGHMAVACYRIAQEALNNIVRHAAAQNACVTLRHRNGRLSLEIADDGAGFDVRSVRIGSDGSPGLGIVGMEERARLAGGTLMIDSRPGRGTRVRAEFGPEVA